MKPIALLTTMALLMSSANISMAKEKICCHKDPEPGEIVKKVKVQINNMKNMPNSTLVVIMNNPAVVERQIAAIRLLAKRGGLEEIEALKDLRIYFRNKSKYLGMSFPAPGYTYVALEIPRAIAEIRTRNMSTLNKIEFLIYDNEEHMSDYLPVVLMAHGEEKAVKDLVARIYSSLIYIKNIQLVDCLVKARVSYAEEYVNKELKDPDQRVRDVAVFDLRDLYEEKAIPMLENIINDQTNTTLSKEIAESMIEQIKMGLFPARRYRERNPVNY